MANFKHKVFLLIAKWIPVAVAAGILINNTLAMLDVKDVILDLFDITVGSSLAFVIMMYVCSYVFSFCYWHKIVITYDLFVLSYILLIRYTNIGECSDGLLLTIHYILAGIFIALIWYVKKRCKITDYDDGLLNDMIDRLIVSKANTINGVTIGEGSIKVTIPFMNKTVIFDKDDFNELKTNIENIENLNKLIEYYKQTIRIDSSNAWDLVCHFK